MPRFLAHVASLAIAVAFAFPFPLRAATAPALAGPNAPPAGPVPLTAEELFRPSALGHAEISPDGSRFGAIVSDDADVRHLLIVDLNDYKQSGVRGEDEFDIFSFRWLGDDNVLFNVSRDKLFSWGLYTAPLKRLNRSRPLDTYNITRIIGIPRARPGHVLVWFITSHYARVQPGSVAELNATRAGGKFGELQDKTLVHTFPTPAHGTVTGWYVNDEGELTLCSTWFAGALHLHRYHADRDVWQEINLSIGKYTPMALDRDDRFLWVVAHSAENGYELRRLDLTTGELGKVVLSDPEYDLGEGTLYFSPRTHELAGVTYVQRKLTTVWLSPDHAALQAIVDKNYPGTTNVLLDQDRAERKSLFALSGPQRPRLYVLLDLDRKSLDQVAEAAPWLAHRPLLPTQPVSFRSRDGVKLEGYLTLPPGVSEQNPAPLVVLAHGGPWVRDTPDYNPEVQFLASRGYLVLQPNYRGSTGYSPAISDDETYDFRRMHDDVTDATKSMLRSGLVDPRRVAIMGASFGGYLALAGVTFEDGLYCCAITNCGVFDWERLVKSKKNSGRPAEYERLTERLGKPGRDHDSFDRISPLAHADQIKVPVLIAHGTKDNVVDFDQSQKLAAALKARGIPHETFFRKLEGHGFYNAKNRVEFYHRVEAFLAANLGGASLTPVK